MVNSFLFGNQSSSQSKYLLEFKAGKMQMEGTTVNPINKKGLVYLHKTDDDLMHFCWKDRQSGQVGDDLIIFPDDTEFKKVTQCKSGRVFVLKFKSSNKRCFYWMQEPKEDKDDDICKKVNEFLNNPLASTSSRNSLGHSLTDLPESELHNIINNVSSQQLMQILSRVNGVNSNQVLANLLNQSGSSSRMARHSGSSRSKNSSNIPATTASNQSDTITTTTSIQSPSTNTPTTTPVSNVTNATSAGIQLSDLQNIISGLAVNQGKKEANVDLAAVVANSEALKTLLENKEFMDKVKELIPDTSQVEGESKKTLLEQVTDTIESVQFKSALSTFNSALQSGLLGPLIQQFNLSDACVEAANKGDLEEFVKAMESSSKIKKPESTSKKDAVGDSEMADEF